MKSKKLIVVVGPTAIGKTKLAIALAEYFKTQIISSDSRQFFKEMRIGTAVPSEEELASVPHHFIQHTSIEQSYSVGDFEKDAINLLEELYKDNDYVIMVGGSGLYTDAVIHGLDTFPEVPPNIRKELNTTLEQNGIESLQKELFEKDPVYYQKVDLMNPHRVIRALEVIRHSGKPFSSFLRKDAEKRSFDAVYVGITAEREIIYERINLRVDEMIKHGLLEEAKSLYNHRKLNALQTVGYKELFRFLDEEITLDFAISEIKKNTRRFAKRQLTWLRKNPDILWVPYDADFKEIVSQINSKIDGHG
ncbi:tRNA (adenosine(37)-N6)-dimethylallyltransferase MiaA [Flagellimonas meridianipacifica]|uniref:tRNA dimethylallyltransferase n=1 Tax=Flagellimonas meridianipacifica TaxID=1080225 RepID=A0A2T0MAJ4_9FLAO|nr:tRNA (adenosine(37)-N6)-dimethylallyltransferase MiaA [Allomuricauda pacifica]PRX54521.1 tRNA dimethylallyltransferase [Allomuricauda pacifica]